MSVDLRNRRDGGNGMICGAILVGYLALVRSLSFFAPIAALFQSVPRNRALGQDITPALMDWPHFAKDPNEPRHRGSAGGREQRD